MNASVDLFGGELPVDRRYRFDPGEGARVRPFLGLTPALPGSGPKGESCRSCAHAVRITYSKAFYKCGRVRDFWTNSVRTDIKLRWPACSEWAAR